MEITGVRWVGIRTDRTEQTVAFFRDVLRLEPKLGPVVGFKTANGDVIEVFGTDDREHAFFTTGPVPGFGVADVEAARRELEAAGIEFIGPIHADDDERWTHFRGPDGNIYELTQA